MYHKQYREFCFGLSIVTKYFDIDQFQYTISSLQLIYIYIYKHKYIFNTHICSSLMEY